MTLSRTTAILLALFLGGLGIHWFYLRRPGHGLIHLLFCWTLIPSLVAIVDICYFLLLDQRAWRDRYSTL